MIVVFGYKPVHKHEGRAADFCPICCELSPFAVCDVRQAFHVYWIPLWRKGAIARDEMCETCGYSRHIPLEKYSALSRRSAVEVSDLEAETNSGVRARWKERLELESRVRARRISADERKQMLADGWMAVATYAGPNQPSPRVNVGVGLWILAALVFLIAMAVAGGSANLSHQLLIARVLVACSVLSLCLAGYCVLREFIRYRRRSSYDLLARCFERLSPTAAEIEQVRSQLDPQTTRSLARTKPERIISLIDQRKFRPKTVRT